MATTHPTRPGTIAVSFPANTRLEALAAVLAPLGLSLHWRPDPRPRAPQARIRAVVGGAL